MSESLSSEVQEPEEDIFEKRKHNYKIFRKKKLNEVFLFITSRCNSKCKTCFYHDFLNSNQDMTFEQIKKMSETAPQFNKLWLSGGEPFMRDELVEIIKLFYDNNKIKEISLPTNGLLTERIVEKTGQILEQCPGMRILLNFSLDGIGATHDKIRGVPGNFKKTIRSMELIKEKYSNNTDLIVNVATVITPEGYHEAFLRKKVYPLIAEQANRLFKHFKGAKREIAKKYFLGYVRFINKIQDANLQGPHHWGMKCTAGETTFVLDHNGDFRSCEMREPIGNMKDYDFDLSKALYGEQMKKEIEEIGGGKKANCWCTHGCWITSSIKFSPYTMLFRIPWAYHKAKGDLVEDFQLPDIDIEAIENYTVEKETVVS